MLSREREREREKETCRWDFEQPVHARFIDFSVSFRNVPSIRPWKSNQPNYSIRLVLLYFRESELLYFRAEGTIGRVTAPQSISSRSLAEKQFRQQLIHNFTNGHHDSLVTSSTVLEYEKSRRRRHHRHQNSQISFFGACVGRHVSDIVRISPVTPTVNGTRACVT